MLHLLFSKTFRVIPAVGVCIKQYSVAKSFLQIYYIGRWNSNDLLPLLPARANDLYRIKETKVERR